MSQASARVQELRGMSSHELHEQLLGLKKEQFNLRFQRATGQFEKTHRVGEMRRDIARILTLLTEMKTEAAGPVGRRRVVNDSFRKQAPREYSHESQITLRAGGSQKAETKDSPEQQAKRQLLESKDVASDILLEYLKMIEDGEFQPEELAAKLGLQTTAQRQLTKLHGATLTKSNTRAARRATALLIPYLYAHSRDSIAGILKLLSMTSFYETKIPETTRQEHFGGLIALLDLYKIPCVLTAEIKENGDSTFIQLEATTDLTQLLRTDEKVELTAQGDPMEVVLFYSAGPTMLPEKLAAFELPLIEPNWSRRIKLPLGWHEAYVTVNGKTTLLSSRHVA